MASSNPTHWFLSFEDKRIKLQVITASVLVVISGFIVIREQWTGNARNSAYQAILSNQSIQNNRGVIEATETFFDNQSFMSKDRRSLQVMEVYKKSMTRWLGQQPEAQLSDEAQKHLARYQQLVKQ
ncbi:hypothetical protein [Nostoc sp. 'Peltigera membranacea cyanobiont' N6]|uniref:hypothetical protein n=1 Tax=Nostoc sp. 'Peltigera membranacea cyanobiont' N6 TaxID=1261031 RepID=UPI000CF36280|nr:hypothetical protein [Nostoc sp. 'Peltigera membranacea cyanobiont' N6]AVH63568.1 hypothetical protein NPM_1763 [Nostoc sp. 'Peltigera membranacea cyanobiont' N6]